MRINNVHGMIIAIFVSYMVVLSCNAMKEFHVGGAEGWVPHPSQPFNQWAQSNRFHVNDRLVFDYKKDSDSVLVVSKPHYDTCNISNPYLTLSGGKSVYDLGRPGIFFFISGNRTRCYEGGEKVAITVMSPCNSASQTGKSPPHSNEDRYSGRTRESSAVSMSGRAPLGAVVWLVMMVGVVNLFQ